MIAIIHVSAIARFIGRAHDMDCECEDATSCDVLARSVGKL